MRRARAILAAAGATLAAGALAAGARGAQPEPVPERVMVRGYEFGLTLSRQKVRPGRAIVQFVNDGEDPHDLHVQRDGAAGIRELGEVGPGAYDSLDLRLRKRSTYRMWCSLADHRARGMEATLRTRKRRG